MLKRLCLVPFVLGLLGCVPEAGPTQARVPEGAPAEARAANGGPTEAEVKETIRRVFADIYGQKNGGAIPEDVQFEFGAVQFGELTETQLHAGKLAEPAYPVRVPVTITVTYSNNDQSDTYQRGGAKADDVFFFYKDSFGQWNFRTGSL